MEKRRREDFDIEPTTQDDYLKFIYRDVRSIKAEVFGKDGLVNRMTIQETITKVLCWVFGSIISVAGVASGWLIIFK